MSWYVSAGVIAFALGLGLLVNPNYFGIGRMYRDRLMETFMPDPETLRHGNWALAKRADAAKLSEMCQARPRSTDSTEPRLQRPYHLINCNVVMVDSEQVKYRGRGGDSFVLSPLYCGSDATSWYDTRHFVGDGMTLSSAMSISGGAASPNTGVAGAGPTRNRLVSFLMGFFGVRLGYWARNPAAVPWRKKISVLGPNLVYPGIVQGLLGQRLNAAAGFLDLTDGGHFENLGIYELARRRVDVIIVSDAAADKDFTMGDLGNAIERIRVDFGYDIRFRYGTRDLQWLMPGSYEEAKDDELAAAFAKGFDLARRGFAIGTIDYGTDETGQSKEGIVIYLKATLMKGLPGDVYAYAKQNADFPHQSTGDQFFDEKQLEAYRELGFRLADAALSDTWVQHVFEGKSLPPKEESPPDAAEGSGERPAERSA
jgi:hypothetical protein